MAATLCCASDAGSFPVPLSPVNDGIGHRVQNYGGYQTNLNLHKPEHQRGKKQECRIPPLHQTHSLEATRSIMGDREDQPGPPDPQERLQRSSKQKFFAYSGT
jgi:hypothetical protein